MNRTIRLAQLGFDVLASSALESLRHRARVLRIRMDNLDKNLAFAKPVDIPACALDLSQPDDPISATLSSPEFSAAAGFFGESPASKRSLVSPQTQALLYCIIRNLRPRHAFEIGTYMGGTSEAICRALHANGFGTLHTVDPFRPEYISAVFEHWPSELFSHVRFYPTDSMAFFKEMERRRVCPDLVLVDGNHDYEYAAFDIAAAARHLSPGGFIFVDNIAQPGTFFAARDFLHVNPGWRECGGSTSTFDRSKSFDRHRTRIMNTDLIVLRAPRHPLIGTQPRSFARTRWWSDTVSGLRLSLEGTSGTGLLHAQVVLRGFGPQPVEVPAEQTVRLAGASGMIDVAFDHPATAAGTYVYRTVEPWLIWTGDEPLQLAATPRPY